MRTFTVYVNHAHDGPLIVDAMVITARDKAAAVLIAGVELNDPRSKILEVMEGENP